MTGVRVVSALIAFLLACSIVYVWGYKGIVITCLFVSLRSLYEYSRMAMPGPKYQITRMYFIFLGLIAYVFGLLKPDLIMHSFALTTLLLFLAFLLMARDSSLSLEELVSKTGLSVLGILYAGVCPVYIGLLAKLSEGYQWFIFTLLVVFAGDTAAYFVGTRYGKNRLFPRISPNKSVEGAAASIVGSMAMGLLIRHYLINDAEIFSVASLCVLTSIVAQLGDLSESMIKRSFHAKDSGQIMPGHGGLLDRLDGVLFGAPMVYIFVKFLIVK